MKKCKVQYRNEQRSGMFYGIYQYAEPYAGLMVGTAPGQIAYPVAVVEVDGRLKQVLVKHVILEAD